MKATGEAKDFLEFAESFFKLKNRAKFLSKEDREVLLRRVDYLKTQMEEFGRFQNLTLNEYSKNLDKRRIVERWIENIINALLDISKIILASENGLMPKSYRETLRDFGYVMGFDKEGSEKFSRLAELGNT